jgi:hypothetical protein
MTTVGDREKPLQGVPLARPPYHFDLPGIERPGT